VRFQVLTAASMKRLSSGLFCLVAWYKFTTVSELLAASIIRAIMKAASTTETSVYF
jgi:hypothetical protein